MELKFYKCPKCGNILIKTIDSGNKVSCCGRDLREMRAGVTDAATEKHVPVYTVDGNTVSVVVGDVKHPMLEEHLINFIAISTKEGYQVKNLKAGEEPEATFSLTDSDELETVYEYCNLHGLWKA